MTLQELKRKIEDIEITWEVEKVYTELYNTCIDYMNETQNFSLDYLFEDFYDGEIIEEIAINIIRNDGLARLQHFLPPDEFVEADRIYKMNAYGNLENSIDKDDLEDLKADILYEIENNLDENVA